MNRYRRSVGLFYSRDEAEKALRALKDDGFDMNRVNVIAKDADQVTESAGVDTAYDEGNNAAEGAGAGATTGTVLGGIGGLLVGLGTLAIPGVGPIIVAGEAATAIATTLAGAGIGAAAGGIIGGLVGLGIPEDKAKIYSDRVGGGSYLIMVNGTDDDISRAERILRDNGIEEYGVYDANDLDDNTYNRTAGVDRSGVVDTNSAMNTTMGSSTVAGEPLVTSSDRVGINEPAITSDRVEVTEPTTTSDRTVTRGNDPDVIVIEPRDNTSRDKI